MIKHVHTLEEFDKEIANGKTVVDFFATWCGPCKMLSPVIEQLSGEMPDLSIVKVDVDEIPDVAKRYNVFSIPTLIVFLNGEAVRQEAGFKPLPALKAFVA